MRIRKCYSYDVTLLSCDPDRLRGRHPPMHPVRQVSTLECDFKRALKLFAQQWNRPALLNRHFGKPLGSSRSAREKPGKAACRALRTAYGTLLVATHRPESIRSSYAGVGPEGREEVLRSQVYWVAILKSEANLQNAWCNHRPVGTNV